MPLTPDEEKRLREQIRQELEAREERIKDSKLREREGRQRNLEERIRRQIRDEEEENYFTERGYVKHVNRYGETEWLTPEERETRKNRRRSKKTTSSRRKVRQRRKWMRAAINIGAIGAALAVFLFLLRYNPGGADVQTGSLAVRSDVPNARIYLNGKERKDLFTSDTLADLKPGTYYVSVYREGYSVWPPTAIAMVKPNETAEVDFSLTTAGLMGTVTIDADIRDFRVFINGVGVPVDDGGRVTVPAGLHVISVVKDGYLASPMHRRGLGPEHGNLRLRVDFDPAAEVGYLNVSSNRSSAYIYLDDHLTGVKANEGRFPVPVGVYEVRICENGYESFPPHELVRVEAGQAYDFAFNMSPEPLTDTLIVNTRTPGAAIALNGQWLPFVTPMPVLLVSEGTHYVNFMRDGESFADRDIRVDANRLNDGRVFADF